MNENLTPEHIQFFTRAAKEISTQCDLRAIASKITTRFRLLVDPEFLYQCIPPYMRRTLYSNEWNSLQGMGVIAKKLGINVNKIKSKATEMTVHGLIHDRIYLLLQLPEFTPTWPPTSPLCAEPTAIKYSSSK